MLRDCDNCGDNNIPTVNEEAVACPEILSTDCVRTSKYNSYFKIGIGKSLTYVIDTIAKYVKKISQRVDDLHNYVEWEGLLSQVLTDAPTADVAKNDLSGSITFAYTSPGKYTGTLVGAFPAGKTFIYLGSFNKTWGEDVKAYRVDDDTIAIETGSGVDFVDDEILDNTPLYIKVYN